MDIQSVREHPPASPVPQGAPATAAPAAAAKQETPRSATPAELEQAVKHINKAIEAMAPGVEFTIDKEAHATVIKVVDVTTGDVLRQMPTAETLDIAKTLDKLQGLLIKQQA